MGSPNWRAALKSPPKLPPERVTFIKGVDPLDLKPEAFIPLLGTVVTAEDDRGLFRAVHDAVVAFLSETWCYGADPEPHPIPERWSIYGHTGIQLRLAARMSLTIKRLRLDADLSMTKVATGLGVTVSTFSKFERALESNMEIMTVSKILNFYGLRLSVTLVDLDGSSVPTEKLPPLRRPDNKRSK